MKKFLNVLLVICFVVPCFFLITACNQNDPNNDLNALAQIAGRYSASYYQYGEYNEIILNVSKDGKYSMVEKNSEGLTTSTTTIDGYLTVDANKTITSMTINSMLDMLTGGDIYFLGNKIEYPVEISSGAEMEVEAYGNIMEELFKTSVRFKDNYVFIFSYDEAPYLLYKDGAEKLAENSKVDVITTKDLNKIYNAMAMFSSTKYPTYEYDMYFVQDKSFDAETNKSDLIEKVSNNVHLCYTNKFGEVETDATITKVESLDLTTTGTGTAKVTFDVNDVEYVVDATYSIVANEDALPENEIYFIKCDGNDDVEYIAKGTELTSLDWALRYKTYATNNNIAINETNCTGNDAVVAISGYDKTKTGYQVVTFTYRGVSCKQSVFIYDETVNPVVEFDVDSSSKLTINKTASSTAVDYSTLTLKLKYASGKTEKKAWADLGNDISLVNPIAFDKYVTGDKVIIKYNYTFNDATYTFYVRASVNVVNE